jgi:hypothetical protein
MKSSAVGHHVEGKQRSWRRLGYQASETSSQGLGSPYSAPQEAPLGDMSRVGEIPGYVIKQEKREVEVEGF